MIGNVKLHSRSLFKFGNWPQSCTHFHKYLLIFVEILILLIGKATLDLIILFFIVVKSNPI